MGKGGWEGPPLRAIRARFAPQFLNDQDLESKGELNALATLAEWESKPEFDIPKLDRDPLPGEDAPSGNHRLTLAMAGPLVSKIEWPRTRTRFRKLINLHRTVGVGASEPGAGYLGYYVGGWSGTLLTCSRKGWAQEAAAARGILRHVMAWKLFHFYKSPKGTYRDRMVGVRRGSYTADGNDNVGVCDVLGLPYESGKNWKFQGNATTAWVLLRQLGIEGVEVFTESETALIREAFRSGNRKLLLPLLVGARSSLSTIVEWDSRGGFSAYASQGIQALYENPVIAVSCSGGVGRDLRPLPIVEWPDQHTTEHTSVRREGSEFVAVWRGFNRSPYRPFANLETRIPIISGPVVGSLRLDSKGLTVGEMFYPGDATINAWDDSSNPPAPTENPMPSPELLPPSPDSAKKNPLQLAEQAVAALREGNLKAAEGALDAALAKVRRRLSMMDTP